MLPEKITNTNHYIDLISRSLNNINFSDIGSPTKSKDEILKAIRELYSSIKIPEEFLVALFVHRCNYRTIIMDNEMFVVLNFLFFEGLTISPNPNLKIEAMSSELFEKLITLTYQYYYLSQKQDEQYHDHKAVDTFYSRLAAISKVVGDIHSYDVQNQSIEEALVSRHLDNEALRAKSMEKLITRGYISKDELNKSVYWNAFIKNHDEAKSQDDMLVIPVLEATKCLQSKYLSFIYTFEAKHKVTTNDPATYEYGQLVFALKLGAYLYISKQCMERTQFGIESFSLWGQYDDLMQFYFSTMLDEDISQNYTKLLTYKIADLLLYNSYILPQVRIKQAFVPMVEIKKYGSKSDRATVEKLGDIDVLFFSSYTGTLYVVEFKNFQMFISAKSLSTDIRKVKNAVRKVVARNTYVNTNTAAVIESISNFNVKIEDIKDIKSIILTAKPNFYFYKNQSAEFDYYDWIDFKENVEKHLL